MASSVIDPASTISAVPSKRNVRYFISLVFRTVFSFPMLLASILAATIFAFAHRGIADPDIWWHLRNADILVKQHLMIRQDLYSFTTRGAPWINHEWLAELPYYFAYQLFGVRGLYFVLLGALEAILLGVFCLAWLNSKNVKAAFLVSWLAVFLATISFGPRTLLFGWILLVVELVILSQLEKGKDHTGWLPVLFLIWVNTHGSWLIGLTFLMLFVASGFIDGKWGRIEARRWSNAQRRKLLVVCALSLGALFINPYTYHLAFYPFDLAFQQKANISHVTEWQSLNFHELRGKIVFAMLALTISLGLARKRIWRLSELLFVLTAFYSALTYSRFMFLAAIVLTPMLAVELDTLPAYKRELDKPWLNAVLMLSLLFACALNIPSPAYLLETTVQDYPVKALPFLANFRPEGRVLNDYLWGGYLIWNAPHIPVFVDSRVDIFDHRGVFQDYLDLMGGKQSLEILDKYQIRYVLYTKESPLAYLLVHNAGWKLAYDDGTTVLLERVGQQTGGPVAKLR